MDYRVIVSSDTEEDLDRFLRYLVYEKKNLQAARNLNDDYEETITKLETMAGSIRKEDDPDLAIYGYRRIHLSKHRYFLLFRIDNGDVIVDRMFHNLQDYKNRQ